MGNLRSALVGVSLAGALLVSVAPHSRAQEDTSSNPVNLADPGSPANPVLAEFITGVLDRHPAVGAAEAELTAARSRARGQARPLYNPELAVDYENAQSITRQVEVAQTVDWVGKRGARANVAKAEVEAAMASLDVTKKALLTELLTALADYQTRLNIFHLNQRRVELSKDFLDLSVRRNAAGDLPRTELLTARLNLAEARAVMNSAQGDLSLAQERLTAVVGEGRARWPTLVAAPRQGAPVLDLKILPDLPELRLARSGSATFQMRINVARKNRVPDPTVGVRYGDEGTDSLVGVRLSIPVPVRNSFRAEVDAARADLVASEKGYGVLVRQFTARLVSSHRRYLTVVGAWRSWRKSGLGSLEEQRLLLQRLWRAGEINAVDYLVQLNQTFTTETAGAELRGRLWDTWFGWLDASGTVTDWVEAL